MRRRELVAAAGAAVLWRPGLGLAEQPKMPVVGFLSGASSGSFAAYAAAFREGLKSTGYVEGQNIAIEYRWAEGHYDRLPALAAELVARKVDVIATSGSSRSAPAAKGATATIPIVFLTGADPVALGLVANLAHPGGNLTGVTLLVVDLMEKRLDLLVELVPGAKAIALLMNPLSIYVPRLVSDLPRAAREKGLQLHILNASTEGEIEAAFAALPRLHAEALVAGSDAFFNSRYEQIVGLAARYRVPAIYDAARFAAAGGLLAYGPSIVAVYRQLGVYAGKVLYGEKPADLPVEQPSKFELVVNLKTAKELGLKVPPSILARADEVIE